MTHVPSTLDIRTAAKDIKLLSCFGDEILTLHDPDYHGYSCLHYACRFGKEDVVRELLTRGIDPNIRNYHKETAAKVARQYGHEDIANVVTSAVNAKIDTNALRAAATASVNQNSCSPRTRECSSRQALIDQQASNGISNESSEPAAALSRQNSGSSDMIKLQRILKQAVELGMTDQHGVDAVHRNLSKKRFTVQYYLEMWSLRLNTPPPSPPSPHRQLASPAAAQPSYSSWHREHAALSESRASPPVTPNPQSSPVRDSPPATRQGLAAMLRSNLNAGSAAQGRNRRPSWTDSTALTAHAPQSPRNASTRRISSGDLGSSNDTGSRNHRVSGEWGSSGRRTAGDSGVTRAHRMSGEWGSSGRRSGDWGSTGTGWSSPNLTAAPTPPSGSRDGRMVAIWDFDDTLVPWYKMKRAHGETSTLELFDDWFNLNRKVQRELLRGADHSWEGAVRVADLSGSASVAAREAYSRSRSSLASGIDRLESSTEARFNGWMTQARRILETVAARGGINLLVTAAPLCAAVAKAMIFGFSQYFELSHVYSAAEDTRGKTNTIQLAMADGARHISCTCPDYVCVGDGKAEEKSARELRIRFVKVRGWEDLRKTIQ